jgi:hypothetical protein
VEAAVALGKRVLSETPAQPDEQRIDWLFRTCLGRIPQREETRILKHLLSVQRTEFAADPKRAAKLVGAPAAKADAVDCAAWTSVARTVLNLDEFVTRE